MDLFRLGRFRFLGGGFVLYALGAALARKSAPLDLGAYLLGQGFITATQLMTQYSNEYYDLDVDKANPTPTEWSGGSGVLVEGILPPTLARNTAIGLGMIAVALTAGVAVRGHASSGLVVLFLVAVVLSWEYSSPPLHLHVRGLGSVTSGLIVGGITPLAGYGMQGGAWTWPVVLAVVPLVIAQGALILVLDFPDHEGDAKAGKKTLVVRFGRRVTLRICVALVAGTYALLPALVLFGLDRGLAEAVGMTLPVAAYLLWTLFYGAWRDGRAQGRLAWAGVLWFVAVAGAELARAAFEAARARA